MSKIRELGIDRLSVEDRLRLMEEIWDSLDPVRYEITESHREELDRQLDTVDTNSSAGGTWEEVVASLRTR